MAVPPAPDGALDVTTDSATTSTPRPLRTRLALLVALVAVTVGCLASLVYLYIDQRGAGSDDAAGDEQPQAQREELMAQTQQFVLRVNTYGPSWLDDQNRMPRYVAGVSELMTAKFAADFEQSVPLAEAQVAQSGYARYAKVYVVGVASMDPDSATVLVGFNRIVSYPKPGDPSKRLKEPDNPERWAVQLVKTEGEWLVDNYAVISELPEAEEPAPGAPSAPPAPSGAGAPGGGASP